MRELRRRLDHAAIDRGVTLAGLLQQAGTSLDVLRRAVARGRSHTEYMARVGALVGLELRLVDTTTGEVVHIFK